MHTIQKVSAEEALKLVAKAVELAKEIDKNIAVAVSGTEGELISFLRMDGANPATAQIAQSKAYTSARDWKSTRSMGEFMRTVDREQGYWTDTGITGFGGGLPIVQNEKVIGGIGISGLTESEDERIAEEAIQAVFQ
ncbi:MAG: heme-binding protein [Imperialibacter sp.]|uniref:GlcG/HbpS family heme-binding protein n=1 Tax=Imperialibacter sp. TaxID=2038411 RepID=UPI0032EAFAA0